MGNLQLVFPETQYAYTVAASSADPSYPAANVKRPDRLGLTWRATSNTSEWVRADLGSTQTIAGAALTNTNAAIAIWETSTNGTTWTTRATTTLTAANGWTNRLQHIATWTPVAARYVRVTLAATSSPLYAEVAGLLVFSAIETFDQNFADLAIDPQTAQSNTPYIGGGGEGNRESDFTFAVYQISKDHWLRAGNNALGLLQRLARVVGNQSVLVHENNGKPEETYFCRVIQHAPFQIRFKTIGCAMTLEERT